MNSSEKLWVVMPVYNEAESLESVFNEWLPVLRSFAPGFVFCALNDGSKDNSLAVLQKCAEKNPEILVVDKKNSGHGQSCIQGYQKAIQSGADWIFQIDSDGQCDSQYFSGFWKNRGQFPAQYGFRARRGDGLGRILISRVLSLTVWILTGVWVRDSNVPYRLIRKDCMDFVSQIPVFFDLANVLVAVAHQKKYGIHWNPIHFRKRSGGKGGRMDFLALVGRFFRLRDDFKLSEKILA